MRRTVKYVIWVSFCVKCDRCGEKTGSMSEPHMVRRMSSDAGWVRMQTGLRKMDLCPACKRKRMERALSSMEEMLVYG